MAIECHERHLSRSLTVGPKEARGTYSYVVTGCEDHNAARIETRAVSPVVYPGYSYLARGTIDVQRLGGRVYETTVNYEQLEGVERDDPAEDNEDQPTPADDDPLGPEFSFDTSGGTETIRRSFDTVEMAAPAGEVAPNFDRAVNVTFDTVEGVEVYTPKFEWSVTVRLPIVTLAYQQRLKQMTGKVNSNYSERLGRPYRSFFGRRQAECLFIGAAGSFRPGEGWGVTYRFLDSEPARNVFVGNGITINYKRGWEYLWVLYQEDHSQGRKILEPAAAYVERVYEEVDFARLLIGGCNFAVRPETGYYADQ